MKYKRTRCAFVANLPFGKQKREQQTLDHLKSVAQHAFEIALELSQEEGKTPSVGDMLIFIICVMVSLEREVEFNDVVEFCYEYGDDFRAMSTILWGLFAIGLTLPEGFPYTIEDFKQSAKKKG